VEDPDRLPARAGRTGRHDERHRNATRLNKGTKQSAAVSHNRCPLGRPVVWVRHRQRLAPALRNQTKTPKAESSAGNVRLPQCLNLAHSRNRVGPERRQKEIVFPEGKSSFSPVVETLGHRPEAGRTYTRPPPGATRRPAPAGPPAERQLDLPCVARRQRLGSVTNSLKHFAGCLAPTRVRFFFRPGRLAGCSGRDSARVPMLAL